MLREPRAQPHRDVPRRTVDAVEQEYDDEDVVWEPPDHLPPDARRMGLNRSVPDGALLDFAGSLDGAKPLHRATAWVMLVVFGMPVVGYVVRLADTLWTALAP